MQGYPVTLAKAWPHQPEFEPTTFRPRVRHPDRSALRPAMVNYWLPAVPEIHRLLLISTLFFVGYFDVIACKTFFFDSRIFDFYLGTYGGEDGRKHMVSALWRQWASAQIRFWF